MKIIPASYEILSEINGDKILKNLEICGRVCYKSEDKITGESAKKFVAGLIKNQHLAMIEHEIIRVKFIYDRAVSLENVRHRIASYAQESTRYVNYSKDKFGKEITYIDIMNSILLDNQMCKYPIEQINLIFDEWLSACIDAEKHYFRMIELGATAQIARSVLNNSTKTELVVTMNLREWRHFFELRTAKVAHPAMREITIPLLEELKSRIPVIFDDIEVIK